MPLWPATARPSWPVSFQAGALLAAALLAGAGPAGARTLDAAIALHRAGRLEAAVAAYRALAGAPETAPGDVAAALNNACAALTDLGRHLEALEACREAERRRRPAGDPLGLADTLNNLAGALDALGRRDEARAAYEEALERYRAAGSREDEALALANLAALAIGRGSLGEALGLVDQAERLARAAGEAPWANEELRVARANRAVVYERLGAYREALAELRDAAGLGAGDPSRAGTLAINVAVLYRNLGDPWRALAELDRAEALLASVGDRGRLAMVALNRGLVRLIDLDEPAAAAREFRAALALASAAGDREQVGRARCGTGRAALAASELDAAAAELAACLAIGEEVGAPELVWTAQDGLGRVASAAGRADEALVRSLAAVAALETVAAGSGHAGLAEGLVADQRSLFAAAVDRLVERAAGGDAAAAARALALVERARARELLAALDGAPVATPLDAAGLTAFGRGRRDAAWVYFAGERRLWRFRVDRSGVALADAGARDPVFADARAAAADLAASRVPERARLDRLAAALLGDEPAGGRLLVIPDGPLALLPFDLLPAGGGDDRTLLDTTAVATAPSLSVAARLEREPRAAARDLLALADPELPAAPALAAVPAGLLAARAGLAPLPGARREAAFVAERIGGASQVHYGSAASEATLIERAAEGARLLLIAAHTLTDDRLSDGVAIFLAPGGGEDGLVTPAELSAHRLPVDLAILSGCRTATGGARDGRSLSTLAAALLGAGARGVVATRWEVGDHAAAAVVEGLADELARGVEPAEALRRAKLRLARDPRWRQRPQWTGFVLIGEPPALPAALSRTGFGSWAGVAVALAAAALLALAARRSRARATGAG